MFINFTLLLLTKSVHIVLLLTLENNSILLFNMFVLIVINDAYSQKNSNYFNNC